MDRVSKLSYSPNPNTDLIVNSTTNQLDLSNLLTQSNVSNLAISSVKIPDKYSSLLTLTPNNTLLNFNIQNIKSSDLLALVIPTIDELALITSNSSTILTQDVSPLVGNDTDHFSGGRKIYITSNAEAQRNVSINTIPNPHSIIDDTSNYYNNLKVAYSPRRVVDNYTGPTCKVENMTNNTEYYVYYSETLGDLCLVTSEGADLSTGIKLSDVTDVLRISEMYDQKGNTNFTVINSFYSNVEYRPKLTNSGEILFEGGQYLHKDNVGPLLDGDDSYTFIVDWTTTNNNNIQRIFEIDSDNTNNKYAALLQVNDAYGFNGQNNDKHDLVPVEINVPIRTFMVVDNSNLDNNIYINHNGTEYNGKTTDPSSLAVGNKGMCIGAKRGTGEYHRGTISHVLVFDEALQSFIAEQYMISGNVNPDENILNLNPYPSSWFDGANQSTITLSGTNVTSWTDRMDSTKSFSPEGGLNSTGFTYDQTNIGIGIYSEGTDIMKYSDASGIEYSSTSTFYIATTPSEVTNAYITSNYDPYGAALAIISGFNNKLFEFFDNSYNTVIRFDIDSSDWSSADKSKFYIICMKFDSGNLSVYLNGTHINTISYVPINEQLDYLFGTKNPSTSVITDYMKGSIGDIIHFNSTAHDDNTRNIVERYLMNKYQNNIIVPQSEPASEQTLVTLVNFTTGSNGQLISTTNMYSAGFGTNGYGTLSPIHNKTIKEISMYISNNNVSYGSVTVGLYYSTTSGGEGTLFGTATFTVSANYNAQTITFTNTDGLYIPNSGSHYFYLRIISVEGTHNTSSWIFSVKLGSSGFPTGMYGTNSYGSLRTDLMPNVTIKGY
jgi:hypothetical protein